MPALTFWPMWPVRPNPLPQPVTSTRVEKALPLTPEEEKEREERAVKVVKWLYEIQPGITGPAADQIDAALGPQLIQQYFEHRSLSEREDESVFEDADDKYIQVGAGSVSEFELDPEDSGVAPPPAYSKRPLPVPPCVPVFTPLAVPACAFVPLYAPIPLRVYTASRSPLTQITNQAAEIVAMQEAQIAKEHAAKEAARAVVIERAPQTLCVPGRASVRERIRDIERREAALERDANSSKMQTGLSSSNYRASQRLPNARLLK